MDVTEKPPVAEQLAALRRRAGLTKAFMARQLGYKQTSGYSYYEDNSQYRRNHLPPDMIQQLMVVLVGLGDPPITLDEVLAMAPRLPAATVERITKDPPQAPRAPEMSTVSTRPGHLFLTLKQEVTTAQFLAIMKILHEDER